MNEQSRLVKKTLARLHGVTELPVVGRRLEVPVALAGLGLGLPYYLGARPKADDVSAETRADVLTAAALEGIVPEHRLADTNWHGVTSWLRARRRYLHKTVFYNEYNEHGQRMDIWRRRDLTGPAPVLLFVPGGAWMMGRRTPQGYALMSHMVEQGWVCLAIDYRVSPKHAWPAQLDDVKAALAWARENVDRFGGDPDFVAIAGASAGGHMASLIGLTHEVEAVVSLYGKYDWEDRSTPMRDMFVEFVDRIIVKKRYHEHRSIYTDASPIANVHRHAPPFLVIHGTADFLIPVEEARDFADVLEVFSDAPVAYLELPGAQHGFDLFDRVRTSPVVTGIGLFLNEAHQLGKEAAAA